MIESWIENLDAEVATIHQGPGPFFWPIGKHGQQCGPMLRFDEDNESRIIEQLKAAGFTHIQSKLMRVSRHMVLVFSKNEIHQEGQ